MYVCMYVYIYIMYVYVYICVLCVNVYIERDIEYDSFGQGKTICVREKSEKSQGFSSE